MTEDRPWPARWDAHQVRGAFAALVAVADSLSELEEAEHEFDQSPEVPPLSVVLDAVKEARGEIHKLEEFVRGARRLATMTEARAIEKDGERRSSPSRPKEA